MEVPIADREVIAAALDDYDWQSVFEYAGELTSDPCGSKTVNPCVPGCSVSLVGFSRSDVAEVIYLDEGENDGPGWVIAGRLDDGRWFLLEAWCDYTGWD